MRERPVEARPVIMSELQQMLDKGVWHGVKLSHLTYKERTAIIRSSMFLKDKNFASGVFEKFMARLVAGNYVYGRTQKSMSDPFTEFTSENRMK
jgi:hypothetical protein